MASKARVANLATGRPHLTATVAPHTLARIDRFAHLAGLSRGEIIDRAIDCLDVCEACQGSGRRQIGSDGRDRGECQSCSGHRIVPAGLVT